MILNKGSIGSQESSLVDDKVVLVTIKHEFWIIFTLLGSITDYQGHKAETQSNIFVTKDPIVMILIKFKTIGWWKLVPFPSMSMIESFNFITFHSNSLFTHCHSFKNFVILGSAGVFFISDDISISLGIKYLLSCVGAISGVDLHVFFEIPYNKAI